MNIESFTNFIKSISLSTIQPTKIDVECLGEIPNGEINIQISWKLMYPNEKSFIVEDNTLQLFPVFDIFLSCDNKIVYSHKSNFIIAMNIIDRKSFEELWESEEIRSYFKDKQILKTLWPIVRQQVLDGLSRLSLPPISLPWIM